MCVYVYDKGKAGLHRSVESREARTMKSCQEVAEDRRQAQGLGRGREKGQKVMGRKYFGEKYDIIP